MTPPPVADPSALPADYRLFAFADLDSTNDEAMRRLAAGAACHGDVIRAERQSAGRGRRGRRWHSPAGNLHVSIIAVLPPFDEIGQIAFVAALAVGAAADEVAPKSVDVRYKWPNDILIDGRKMGGILIETDRTQDAGGHAVVGFGINLAEAPADTSYPATSLGAAGAGEVSPAAFLGPLCRGFDRWYRRWTADGFAPVRAAWLDRAAGIGAAIEARLATETVHGTFRGINEAGALVLAQDGGRERIIPAADVFFRAA